MLVDLVVWTIQKLLQHIGPRNVVNAKDRKRKCASNLFYF